MSFTKHTSDSPVKRNFISNKFVNSDRHLGNISARNGSCPTSAVNAGLSKMTYSQRKTNEKEEDDYSRMFQLFENKAEVEYLNSCEDDKLAAIVYADAKRSTTTSGGNTTKAHTSGYDFGVLLKDEPDIALHQSWRKY
jgi:hypothetical protein